MPLPIIAHGGPGGMLYCEYADSSSGERHALRFYVGPFDPTPTGPSHDYTYQPRTGFTPSEGSILDTFAGLGAVWAPYYTPSWALSIVAVAYNQDGVLTILPLVPTASPISGTAAATLPAGVSVRRIFRLYRTGEDKHALFLGHMPGTQVDIGSHVTPTAGGLDARDRAFVAYVSGPDTAIVNERGHKLRADGSVAVWWADRRVAPTPGAGGTRDQFIGPVPPDLPQDGWLWADTAGLSAPPYPLKVWNASAGAWQQVGAVSSHELPVGHIGDLLVHDGSAWKVLPPRHQNDTLTLVPAGTKLTPQWEPCCGSESVPTVPPVTTGTSGMSLGPTRCGAALRMASWLEQYYAQTHAFMNGILGKVLGVGLAVIVDGLIAVLTDGMGVPLLGASQAAIVAAARFIGGTLNINAFPPLTTTQDRTILQACYCALPAGVTDFAMSDAIINAWEENLSASASVFQYSQLGLLLRLIEVPALSVWQKLAYQGAQTPSTLCSWFTCGSGAALRGGAVLSSKVGAGLSGGALCGTGGVAMQGGATFAYRLTHALSGGGVSS